MTLVIDAHVHLGVDPAHGFRLSRSELIERMDRGGVHVAVAAPFPGKPMARANEALAAALGDRIIGAGLIRPGSADAVAEVDRLVDDYGMKAALIDIEATFEYFLAHGVLGKRDGAAFDRLAQRALPVFLHTHHPLQRFITADLAIGVDALARRYPGLPLIVNTRIPSLTLVLGHANVYVESSLDTASPVDLDSIRRQVGANRLLFASNAPIEHPLIKKMAFERTSASESERALMLGGNVARLLKIEHPHSNSGATMEDANSGMGAAPVAQATASVAAPPITVNELERRLASWLPKLDDAEPVTVFQPRRGKTDVR
ncbi:MAG: amidohydrolase family protein [Hyphomicrobiales bacterium]|nr:amidohydrolase family protein [Hyphomicrobiales bacterium]